MALLMGIVREEHIMLRSGDAQVTTGKLYGEAWGLSVPGVGSLYSELELAESVTMKITDRHLSVK